jgi:predicted RND superfamily exporter protein
MTNFIKKIIDIRILVIFTMLMITLLAGFFTTNLRIVIDPMAILPASHPFVASKLQLENIFSEHYSFVVAIEPKSGNPLDPVVLQKIQRITSELKKDSGLVKSTLLSVASQNAKAILDNGGESFEVRPLHTVLNQPEKLRAWLDSNPIYRNAIVSPDYKALTVLAQFKPDPQGYGAILKRIQPIVDKERDDSMNIYLSGHVNFLGQIELYSERMVILVPIAIVLIALLLFSAFGSLQGLLLPLLTANLALIWVLGIMGASGIPLDVFNATTPILILAIAAGHAVQMLKRYYEEYERLRLETDLTPKEANELAVINSVSKVGKYMIAASVIAAMGFLSLTIFEIKTVKIFGIFTGLGILSALLIELTFMPALRSWLKPPVLKPKKHSRSLWNFIINFIAKNAPTKRFAIFWIVAIAVVMVGIGQVKIENSNKANFAEWTTVRQDDAFINQQLGGTQTFYIMIDTGQVDGVKNPAVLNAMATLQKRLIGMDGVGKTVSLVNFITRMHQVMRGTDSKDLPETAETVGQYLLLYSMSGDPDDLKSYVDFNYQRANMKVFVKKDDSAFIMNLVEQTQAIAKELFPQGVTLQFGGGVAEAAALNEVLVHDKLLNIAQIIGVVFIASSLLFRSVLAGFLVLLPLVMTVIFNFGLLGWLDIPLNIPTSLISAMAVGIGADYAIYLISRYREEYQRDPKTALTNTLNSAGKACLYVASAVAIGYGVLALSFGFKVHQWLALLIACAMFISVFAALTLIPAILQRFQPNFIKRI